ncbi:MAG: hypothetical protein EAZ95_10900 [Bacteroidetes bacterium]|nr:MAG: hypothetical protein EAZ95_10900 [Bacteroidota bacterium]
MAILDILSIFVLAYIHQKQHTLQEINYSICYHFLNYMNVYKTLYATIDFFEEKSLLQHTWLPTSAHISEESYKMEVLNYYNCVLEFRPIHVIFDLTTFFYPIRPELQQWSNENATEPAMALGLKKMAIVVAKDFFATISVEQTIEESAKLSMITRYFKSLEDAQAWVHE